MTENNPKNRLQEFCQKHKYDMPVYDYKNEEDDFNSEWGGFLSRCVIYIDSSTSIVGVGRGRSKKDAEKMAAQDVYNRLMKSTKHAVKDINTTLYYDIYIDIENINVNELSDLFDRKRYDKAKYVFKGFLSSNHHYAHTLQEYSKAGNNFEKILVPSTRRDAADIGMIMAMTSDICFRTNGRRMYTPDKIICVSRDKFSVAFCELSGQKFYDRIPSTEVIHCSCVKDLEVCLETK